MKHSCKLRCIREQGHLVSPIIKWHDDDIYWVGRKPVESRYLCVSWVGTNGGYVENCEPTQLRIEARTKYFRTAFPVMLGKTYANTFYLKDDGLSRSVILYDSLSRDLDKCFGHLISPGETLTLWVAIIGAK